MKTWRRWPYPYPVRVVLFIAIVVVVVAVAHLLIPRSVPRIRLVPVAPEVSHPKVTQPNFQPALPLGHLLVVPGGKKLYVVADGHRLFGVKWSAGRFRSDGLRGETAPTEALAVKRLHAILSRATYGVAFGRIGKSWIKVPVLYDGKQIGSIKFASSGQLWATQRPWLKLGGDLFKRLTGWIAFGLAVAGTLSYPWLKQYSRRLLRRRTAGASVGPGNLLKHALQWHIAISLVAGAAVLLHVWTQLARPQISTGWVALFMLVTVVLSGLIGRYLRRFQVGHRYWGYFHVPYSLLFYAVLAFHVANRTHVFRLLGVHEA